MAYKSTSRKSGGYSRKSKGGTSDAEQIMNNSKYGASPRKTGMKMGAGGKKRGGRKS